MDPPPPTRGANPHHERGPLTVLPKDFVYGALFGPYAVLETHIAPFLDQLCVLEQQKKYCDGPFKSGSKTVCIANVPGNISFNILQQTITMDFNNFCWGDLFSSIFLIIIHAAS